MAIGLRNRSLDAQDLKGVVYMSWRLPPDHTYVEQSIKYKHLDSKDCRRVNGTGTNIAH